VFDGGKKFYYISRLPCLCKLDFNLNILTNHHSPGGAVAAYRLVNQSSIPKFGRDIAFLR
jgi:hypothetical protein